MGLSTDEYVNFLGSLSTDKNIKSSFSALSFLVMTGSLTQKVQFSLPKCGFPKNTPSCETGNKQLTNLR